MYFNQLLGAAHTRKLVETLFQPFSTFLIFKCFSKNFRLKSIQTFKNVLTQSKSKTIITRSMCVISLIVFTDPYLGHVWTFYTESQCESLKKLCFKLLLTAG